MTITLVKVVETCSGAPSQWDAWDADGQYYYMRFRHGGGTVHAEPGPDEATWTSFPKEMGRPFSDGAVAHFRRSHDIADSCITLQDFLDATGLQLAPGATVHSLLEEELAMADAAVEAPPQTPAAPATPTPKMKGTFALYDTDKGGLHLVYRSDDNPDQDQHIPVPAFIVSMAQRAASGGGLDAGMLGKLMGMGQ